MCSPESTLKAETGQSELQEEDQYNYRPVQYPEKPYWTTGTLSVPERARAQQSVPTVWRLWKRFGVDMVDNSNGMVGRMEEEKENHCQHKLRSLRWLVKRTMATLHARLSAAVVAKTNKKSDLSCNCSRMLLSSCPIA